jgi:chromosome transmission fidelity protein 18
MYRSAEIVATELLPYTLRILSPDVKPVIINTSTGSSSSASKASQNISTASVRRAPEKELVARSVNCMAATGVRFEKVRVEYGDSASYRTSAGGWVYRMEPPLDAMSVFETMDRGRGNQEANVRYAVRQVLEQEFIREEARIASEKSKKRGGIDGDEEDKEEQKSTDADVKKIKGPKKDFFGRIVQGDDNDILNVSTENKKQKGERKVWVKYQEGFSNAVRKPISLKELMDGL